MSSALAPDAVEHFTLHLTLSQWKMVFDAKTAVEPKSIGAKLGAFGGEKNSF